MQGKNGYFGKEFGKGERLAMAMSLQRDTPSCGRPAGAMNAVIGSANSWTYNK